MSPTRATLRSVLAIDHDGYLHGWLMHPHGPSTCAVRRTPVPDRRERGVRAVMLLAGVTMIIELVVGYATHSMALLADGWHMATHVGALAIASAAYVLSRRYAEHAAFGFGTGKISALAGFTSGLGLGIAAFLMFVESIRRLADPSEIDFASSIPVAIAGLVVNVISVALLERRDQHDDGDDHDHDAHHAHDHHGHHHGHHHHGHAHHDHNHRAVVLHVLADALTSALAIGALVIGYFTGIAWLDAVTGIVGSLVILQWVISLTRGTARELLDIDPDGALQRRVRACLEAEGTTQVLDVRVWSVGAGRYGCVVTVSSTTPLATHAYRERILVADATIAHVTVEVRRSADHTAPLLAA